jgi:hypothetical protein
MYDDFLIEKALEILREIKKNSNENPRFGFDEDWISFIKKMQFLSPKSFGTRIQNRIIEKNNFGKVNPSDDMGDFSSEGNFFEFKTSILTTSNKGANFVNIRPYQNIYGYFCLVVNTNELPYETHQFYLNKIQMAEELIFMKANASNGTIVSNKENKNISYRFTLDFSTQNDNLKRWLDNYTINHLIL